MKDWKKALRNVAPVLGGVLGGPNGAMAGRFLSRVIFGREDATEGEIADYVLNASPEEYAKIREAEIAFEQRLAELKIDADRLIMEDRADARDLGKVKGLAPHIILSAVFISGFFGVIFVLLYSALDLSEAQEAVLHMLLGVLGSGVMLQLRFWFGGSPQDADLAEKIYRSRADRG